MTWVRISDDWWRQQRVGELSPRAQALFVRLLSRAGETNSFGAVTRADLLLVAGGPVTKPIAELIRAGFIVATSDGWQVSNPEQYFLPPDQVQRRRAQRSAAGSVGGAGRARTADRTQDGRFAPASLEVDGLASDGPSGLASGLPSGRPRDGTPAPLPVFPYPYPEEKENPIQMLSLEEVRPANARGSRFDAATSTTDERTDLVSGGTGKGSLNHPPTPPMPNWDEPGWAECKDAWEQRGLKEPPTPPQRSLLWPAVSAFPESAAGWIAEASHEGTTFEIVRHVLKRAEAEWGAEARRGQFNALTADEHEQWLDLERGLPIGR